MVATEAHRAAESRFRRLLEDAELPPPDRVDYEPAALTFFWDATKTAVVVDLEGPEPET